MTFTGRLWWPGWVHGDARGRSGVRSPAVRASATPPRSCRAQLPCWGRGAAVHILRSSPLVPSAPPTTFLPSMILNLPSPFSAPEPHASACVSGPGCGEEVTQVNSELLWDRVSF